MPIRMLRDWTDSDKVNRLTVYAERFFIRLIMKVDDYGCFYADARLLKANLFPLLLDGLREADISRWMAECQKAGLIVLYESQSKEYLQIVDFKQRLDKARAKYPLPIKKSNDFPELVNDFPAETETERKPKGKEARDARAQGLEKSNLFKKPVIPTKIEVWEAFQQNGGTREMARGFYDDYEATGWFHKGSPLENFRSRVYSYVQNWKKNEKEKSPEKSGAAPLKYG